MKYCLFSLSLFCFLISLTSAQTDVGGGGGGPFGPTHERDWNTYDLKTKKELIHVNELTDEFFKLDNSQRGKCFKNSKADNIIDLYLFLNMKKEVNGQLRDQGNGNSSISFKEKIELFFEHKNCTTNKHQFDDHDQERCFFGPGHNIMKKILKSPHAKDYFMLKYSLDKEKALMIIDYYKGLM